MKNKLNLSVLLTIKSAVTKDFSDYFEKSITSLKNQTLEFKELIIVHTNEETLTNHSSTINIKMQNNRTQTHWINIARSTITITRLKTW